MQLEPGDTLKAIFLAERYEPFAVVTSGVLELREEIKRVL